MRCWASQRGGAELRTRSLPGAVRRRIERLRARGCRVSLQRLPSRFAFVTLALVQSECARFTCVGTAASRDPERAVVSAMGEAECLAWACLAGYGRRSVRPAQVRTGWDHADLLTNPEYFRRADCLRSRRGSEALRSPKRLPESTDNFLSELADWAGALIMNLSLPEVGAREAVVDSPGHGAAADSPDLRTELLAAQNDRRHRGRGQVRCSPRRRYDREYAEEGWQQAREIHSWSTTTSSTPEFTWTVAPNKREQLHKDVPLALVCGLGCSY